MKLKRNIRRFHKFITVFFMTAVLMVTQPFGSYLAHSQEISNNTIPNGPVIPATTIITYDDDDDDDDDDDSSDTSTDTSDTSSNTNSSDEYDSSTSTSDFITTSALWATPVATAGESVYVVLPLLNMFKYNVKDVVVTPIVSEKTDEFPFEIDAVGFTQKIGLLLGEDAQPDRKLRFENCVWEFRTRQNVKTGYYKLNFKVVYTNPVNKVENCTISTFVRTIGDPKYGNTDGEKPEEPKEEDKDKKKATPRVIVRGFTTVPDEVQAGENFELNIVIENTSKRTAVNNMELDLTGTVAGKDEASSYAAFLPTSGANSFYVERIPAGGTKQLSMEFTAKADLEQKPYVMDIKMQYEDDEANPYEGSASVSIPVHQISKFDTSTPDVEPSSIEVGEQSDITFNIYNTGKTKLYNVSVSVNAPSLEFALAYLGGIDSGGTGNVDLMVTGIAATEDDGNVDCVISYEDESGNVTYETKTVSLFVNEPVYDDYDYEEDIEDGSGELLSPTVRNILIAAGSALGVIILIIIAVNIGKSRRKKREEEELAAMEDEDEIK